MISSILSTRKKSMHDSTNTVAMSTVKVLYPDIVDVGCFSHTLDHVGEHFRTPTLNEFVTNWLTLFAHSPKARLAWRSRTGKSVRTYSKTRWWSQWEVIEQMLVMFGDILPFLEDNSDLGPATRTKMLAILQKQLSWRRWPSLLMRARSLCRQLTIWKAMAL